MKGREDAAAVGRPEVRDSGPCFVSLQSGLPGMQIPGLSPLWQKPRQASLPASLPLTATAEGTVLHPLVTGPWCLLPAALAQGLCCREGPGSGSGREEESHGLPQWWLSCSRKRGRGRPQQQEREAGGREGLGLVGAKEGGSNFNQLGKAPRVGREGRAAVPGPSCLGAEAAGQWHCMGLSTCSGSSHGPHCQSFLSPAGLGGRGAEL